MTFLNYRFSTAPMMERTDRHWRVFARTLTQKALLYTEMVTAPALIHGNLDRLTQHSTAGISSGIAGRRIGPRRALQGY